MSADNWEWCPQCMAVAEAVKKENSRIADEAYGKVLPDEYDRQRALAEEDIKLEETMREDYELGVDLLGEFKMHFSASCSTCGYSVKFEYKEQTKVEAK